MFSDHRESLTSWHLKTCFDTESSAFLSLYSGWGTAEQNYELLARLPIRFDAAVVYDGKKYFEFGPNNVAELVTLLARADEIISFNGLRRDLVILECLCGKSKIEPLRLIPHHDLLGWKEHSLISSIRQFDKALADAMFDKISQLALRYQRRGHSDFISSKLAKARIDVDYTWYMFHHYAKSGEQNYTYRPSRTE